MIRRFFLACIVYWQGCEISRVLSQCDPLFRAAIFRSHFARRIGRFTGIATQRQVPEAALSYFISPFV